MDVEMVQTINSVLASICGLTLHCYILYKLLRNHSSLSQYQNLIVVQSAVGAVYAVVQLIANERQAMSGQHLMSFAFLLYDPVGKMIMLFLTSSLYSLEQFLVMIFNIHRVLMLVRERWITRFYIVLTPIALAYSAVFGAAKLSSMNRLETAMRLLFVPSILIISTVCYIYIRRFFRSNSRYTPKVKQMQARFSTSFFLEGIIHGVLVLSVLLLVPLNFLFATLTSGDWRRATTFSLIYMIIVMLLFRWYSFFIGALTLWSIFGFIKHKVNGPRNASKTIVPSRLPIRNEIS